MGHARAVAGSEVWGRTRHRVGLQAADALGDGWHTPTALRSRGPSSVHFFVLVWDRVFGLCLVCGVARPKVIGMKPLERAAKG